MNKTQRVLFESTDYYLSNREVNGGTNGRTNVIIDATIIMDNCMQSTKHGQSNNNSIKLMVYSWRKIIFVLMFAVIFEAKTATETTLDENIKIVLENVLEMILFDEK